jgi:hypothetical protein
MKRTLSAVASLVVSAMLLLAVGLLPSPAQAKCRKDCKQTLAGKFKACKSACPKRKPGKACRAACTAAFKTDKATCRGATNPTPPNCGASTTTTTTPASGTTTTTVACSGSPTGTIVAGALTPTPGRFNYNLTLGLPGANAACNTNFPGSHACTLAELQSAPASDLACLRDTASNSVTSFWAIDSNANPLQQCQDDVGGGSGLNWEYATAHTGSRGQKVALANATGVLGSLQTGLQCNLSGSSAVGCCH